MVLKVRALHAAQCSLQTGLGGRGRLSSIQNDYSFIMPSGDLAQRLFSVDVFGTSSGKVVQRHLKRKFFKNGKNIYFLIKFTKFFLDLKPIDSYISHRQIFSLVVPPISRLGSFLCRSAHSLTGLLGC